MVYSKKDIQQLKEVIADGSFFEPSEYNDLDFYLLQQVVRGEIINFNNFKSLEKKIFAKSIEGVDETSDFKTGLVDYLNLSNKQLGKAVNFQYQNLDLLQLSELLPFNSSLANVYFSLLDEQLISYEKQCVKNSFGFVENIEAKGFEEALKYTSLLSIKNNSIICNEISFSKIS